MQNKNFTKKYAAIAIALTIFIVAFGGALVAQFRGQIKSATKQQTQSSAQKTSKTEQIQNIASTLMDIAPYVKTQDSEGLINYFAAKACEKVPVENKEACQEALKELIVLAQQAGSVEELKKLIQAELTNNQDLQAVKNDLLAIVTYMKTLITDQHRVTQEELKALSDMTKTFLTTYGDIVRMATVLSEYGCPHTKLPEACKVVINDLLYAYTNGQDPQTAANQIAADLKQLAITSIPSIHEKVILILQTSADIMLMEEEFISIRYSENDPQAEPTRTVYQQGQNAIAIHINDLNAIYAQIEPILANPSQESLAELKPLINAYAMELIEVGKTYQQFYPAMRGGMGYIANFERNQYLGITEAMGKDLLSLMILSQEEKGFDTTSVQKLISNTPTSYKQIGQPKNIALSSGNTFDINPKVMVSAPTDAGLLELDQLTKSEVGEANQEWLTVINTGKDNLEKARVAQAEAQIYSFLLQEQKVKIAKEICKVFSNNNLNCQTNISATLNAIKADASSEEVLHVFCQNKPNPPQCENLKNIIIASIESAESLQEFVDLVKQNTETPITPEEIQARVTELQTLLKPLADYLALLIEEEDGIDEEDIKGLLQTIFTIIAGTEKGDSLEEKAAGTLCDAETQEELEQCRNTIVTVLKMIQEGATQEEIMTYLLSQVDSVEDIKEHSDDIVQFVKLLLISNRITTDFLRNREGEQSIGVPKLIQDYSALYELYTSLVDAYNKMLEGQDSAATQFVKITYDILDVLNDYYLNDLVSGIANTSNPAEMRYMRNSEIFGYDATPMLKIIADVYHISVEDANVIAQQILNDSRTGKGMIAPLKAAWDLVFSASDDQTYKTATDEQKTLNELMKKITQEKSDLLAELVVAAEEADQQE